MRHRAIAILAAAVSVFAVPRPAAAYDTIDCDRDGKPAERVICSSQSLQILDAKITEVYAEMMQDRTFNARIKRDLLVSQRTFLARRDACGWDQDCVEEVMSLRSSRIQFYR
jgi:uncharacterized protein